MKTVKTKKGTELPLISLKGKDYLMVAYRIQWMNEEVPKFHIATEFLSVDDEQTIAKATVTLFDEAGLLVKSATATKRETKKDFADHTEKAETAAIGRALAMLGYGTQFALADLDEGERLADSPLASAKTTKTTEVAAAKPTSSFRKKKAENTDPVLEKALDKADASINPQTNAVSSDGWEN